MYVVGGHVSEFPQVIAFGFGFLLVGCFAPEGLFSFHLHSARLASWLLGRYSQPLVENGKGIRGGSGGRESRDSHRHDIAEDSVGGNELRNGRNAGAFQRGFGVRQPNSI